MQKQRELSTTYKRALVSNKGAGAKFDSHCGSLRDDFKSVKGQLNAEQAKFMREMKFKLPAINISKEKTSKLLREGLVAKPTPLKLDKATLLPLERDWNQSRRNQFVNSQSDGMQSMSGFEEDFKRVRSGVGSRPKALTFLDTNDELIRPGVHGRSNSMGNIPLIITEKFQDFGNGKRSSDCVSTDNLKSDAKFQQETDVPSISQTMSSSTGNLKILTGNENSEKQQDTMNGIKLEGKRRANSNEEKLLPNRKTSLQYVLSPRPIRRKAQSTCTLPNRKELLVPCGNRNIPNRKLSWNPTVARIETLDLKQHLSARRKSQGERPLNEQFAEVKDLRYLRGGRFTPSSGSASSSDDESASA